MGDPTVKPGRLIDAFFDLADERSAQHRLKLTAGGGRRVRGRLAAVGPMQAANADDPAVGERKGKACLDSITAQGLTSILDCI